MRLDVDFGNPKKNKSIINFELLFKVPIIKFRMKLVIRFERDAENE
jgi:hypothetical protein